MVSIGVPRGASAAKLYVLEFVFREILKISYSTCQAPVGIYRICRGNRSIELPDIALTNASDEMPATHIMPNLPLKFWPVDSLGENSPELIGPLPIMFGSPGLDLADDFVRCNVDLFGSIFFMLSRYEEVVSDDRDVHDRFPANASLAFKAGFLNRPIVDEYVEFLWALMSYLWPELRREQRRGRVLVTCDVDQPFDCTLTSKAQFLRTLAGDILKRRDVRAAGERIRKRRLHRRGDHHMDPNYTFDWYMESCEQVGLKAAFFFISGRTAGKVDGCYELSDGAISRLIDKIAVRGHEIGVHGSYNGYQDAGQVAIERGNMITTCQRLGLDAAIRGNRQHYLRWDSSQTPDHLDSAGYEYDTSGGFPDAPGFRFGTARPFTMWSWQKKAPLRLKQQPLVLMETTLLSSHYLGLGCCRESLELSLAVKRRALKFGGDFTFLWHNSNLATEQECAFFKELIQ